jgi:hypothetical protein
VEHQGGAVDLAVGAEVEGLRLQHVGHAADGIGVEQDAAEHRLLGLQVLGGHAIGQAVGSFAAGRPLAPVTAACLGQIGAVGRQRQAHHGGSVEEDHHPPAAAV